MKEKRILFALNDIDDKYIEEAASGAPRTGRDPMAGRINKKIIMVAAVAVVLAMLSVVLFVANNNDTPPKTVDYSSSEYYDLIKRLHEYQTVNGKYPQKDKWGIMEGNAVSSENPSISSEDSSGYVEVTDNQVEGVIEADLLKRTDEYLFYLSGDLIVYSIEGKASKEINRYDIPWAGAVSRGERTMFLSSDCTTITILEYNDYELIIEGTRKTGISKVDRFIERYGNK